MGTVVRDSKMDTKSIQRFKAGLVYMKVDYANMASIILDLTFSTISRLQMVNDMNPHVHQS